MPKRTNSSNPNKRPRYNPPHEPTPGDGPAAPNLLPEIEAAPIASDNSYPPLTQDEEKDADKHYPNNSRQYFVYRKTLFNKGYDVSLIKKLCLRRSAKATVEYVIENHDALINHPAFSSSHKKIIKVASHSGGLNNLKAVIEHYDALKAHGLSNTDIVKLASHDGGSNNLKAVSDDFVTLKAFGFSNTDIVKIASHQGGSNNLKAVIKYYDALKAHGLSNADIVKLASHHGGAKRLQAKSEKLNAQRNADLPRETHPLTLTELDNLELPIDNNETPSQPSDEPTPGDGPAAPNLLPELSSPTPPVDNSGDLIDLLTQDDVDPGLFNELEEVNLSTLTELSSPTPLIDNSGDLIDSIAQADPELFNELEGGANLSTLTELDKLLEFPIDNNETPSEPSDELLPNVASQQNNSAYFPSLSLFANCDNNALANETHSWQAPYLSPNN